MRREGRDHAGCKRKFGETRDDTLKRANGKKKDDATVIIWSVPRWSSFLDASSHLYKRVGPSVRP